MMYSFSKKSRFYLDQCVGELSEVAYEAIKYTDFSVIEAHRGKEAQNEAYAKGLSKLKYPDSQHNKKPSEAFHLLPHPFDGEWESPLNHRKYSYLAGIVIANAKDLGYNVIWGGDWDQDGDLGDQTFNDLLHYEMKRS